MNGLLEELLCDRKSAKLAGRLKYSRNRLGLSPGFRDGNFLCLHCRQPVSFDPIRSAVHNRNHCPYCLWSRHVDLVQAGDRLAACKAPMRPVGVAVKRTRKKYTGQAMSKHPGGDPQGGTGELMLVHQCVECGKARVNRVAADDCYHTLWSVFEFSLNLDGSQLAQDGINILHAEDEQLVRARLFGSR
jgi:hypothetical protein